MRERIKEGQLEFEFTSMATQVMLNNLPIYNYWKARSATLLTRYPRGNAIAILCEELQTAAFSPLEPLVGGLHGEILQLGLEKVKWISISEYFMNLHDSRTTRLLQRLRKSTQKQAA